LEVAEQEVVLHCVSLTGADVKTKSLSAFLGETKANVTLETVGGSQPAVAVATAGSPKKHVLLLRADGFMLYPKQLPKASKLYITLSEKSSIIIQTLFIEGVSTEDSSNSHARRTGLNMPVLAQGKLRGTALRTFTLGTRRGWIVSATA
jgi:hypothetical protein